MMTFIFTIFFVSILFAGFNKRQYSIRFFILGFILSIFWFFHHATDVIGLSL